MSIAGTRLHYDRKHHMSTLANYLLIFLLNHVSPGRSQHSLELIPECGSDRRAPTCDVKPICAPGQPMCSIPHWDRYRSSWVRTETKESALTRYTNASNALAIVTGKLSCTDDNGKTIEGCAPVFRGRLNAACSILASSIWESGYREDIMIGAPPSGRGSMGEACVMQVMPKYIARNSPWLTEEQRTSLDSEDLAKLLLGTDQSSLERCYETGGRLLAKFRGVQTCSGKTRVYSMYAGYGTGGNKCFSADKDGGHKGLWWANKRERTYNTCMKKWPSGEKLPERSFRSGQSAH